MLNSYGTGVKVVSYADSNDIYASGTKVASLDNGLLMGQRLELLLSLLFPSSQPTSCHDQNDLRWPDHPLQHLYERRLHLRLKWLHCCVHPDQRQGA